MREGLNTREGVDSMRLIDADKLLNKRFLNGMIDGNELLVSYTDVVNAIRQAPTVDAVEVRHGRWGFDGLGWTCSECGEYALANKSKMQVHSVWCPHCGAKIEGERRENETCD